MKPLFVSLADCEPFVTKDGSIIREILAHRNSAIRHQSLAEATIPPGATTDAHYHPKTEEIYFLTQGEGMMHCGGEVFRVRQGDAIPIPPGTIHWITNDQDEDLKLLCCCAPGYEHDDTVLVSKTH
ncbi:MAG: cupin domain-containing protein [Pirellula sp.]|jgi:mannose-6-phosphate isomerase-like protein (cupin superfamily)|nr:cupin domain-containing protein [Pirellula sp.]